jgi:hypothetical protein
MPAVRATESVSMTTVVPVALLGVVAFGAKEQVAFVNLTKFEHERLMLPLVGPMKSKAIEPEACPAGTIRVNGGTILSGIALLATTGMAKVAFFVKSAMA